MESVGGVNRLKKAKKWMGFAGDVLDKGLSYKEKMGSGRWCGMCDGQGCEMCGSAMCGGKVNRLKKAKKWMGFAGDVMDKGLALKEQTGGVNRLKKAKKWMGFAGDVLDKGLSYKEQTGSGRKPRMVKGSQEAKDYMAKIRAMRKK
jgi:hypothetical protein